MSVLGSNLINTASKGEPDFTADRPASFAIGTQVFLNPPATPIDGVLSFKLDTSLIRSQQTSRLTLLALGLATDAELDSLTDWGSSKVDANSGSLYAVGFVRDGTIADKIIIKVQGSALSRYICRPQTVSSVDPVTDTLKFASHLFSTGDRVIVHTDGQHPDGIEQDQHYFVIKVNGTDIKLALSHTDALAGTPVIITNGGSGTITVASDEVYTLKRSGNTGTVTLSMSDNVVATFSTKNAADPLRPFYWCKEKSYSNSLPLVKEIKVRGAI